MKYILVTVFLVISTCYGQNVPNPVDPVIINNKTVPLEPVTEVNKPPTNPQPITTQIPSTTPNGTITTVAPVTTTIDPKPTPTPPSPPTTPNTTTPTSPTTTTTIAPTTTPSTKATTAVPAPPTTPPPSNNRKFDGPSFVGGIVLALGLVAIGFVAFKFYKARTELNYHTL